MLQLSGDHTTQPPWKRLRQCIRKNILFDCQITQNSVVNFVVLMGWNSRHSWEEKGIWLGNIRVSSLLFADDVVMMVSSSHDLPCAPEQLAAKCDVAAMKVSLSKSEVMVPNRRKGSAPCWSGLCLCLKSRSLSLLWTCSSDGRLVREMNRQIGALSALMRASYRYIMVKTELSQKVKRLIYWSIYVPTLTYGLWIWIVTKRIWLKIKVAEISFLWRVAGLSLRDKVNSSYIQAELWVESLLLYIERSKLRWHLIGITLDNLALEVSCACPTERRQ